MVPRTIIFGNGIGRAINNNFFSLEAALRCAWDEQEILTDRQKELIRACLPEDLLEDEGAPTSEDQLEDLQRIVSACDEIAKMEHRANQVEGWLSNHGQEFPTAIRKYLHRAARYFLDREILNENHRELPEGFSEALREHVMNVGANVVTLNYDDLLYECFTNSIVFRQHRLRDGFYNGNFDIERHDQWIAEDPRREGWFLHLHGSPLFLTRDGVPRKLTRRQLRGYGGIDSTHLVMTNVKYKSSIIEASDILNEYWKRFSRCCEIAEDILLIGYGGGDYHLNQAIIGAPEGATIRIVQRSVPNRNEEEIAQEWQQRLSGRPVRVELRNNILDFRDF